MCHNAESQYFIVMLSAVMWNVVMLNVVMLNVVMLSVVTRYPECCDIL